MLTSKKTLEPNRETQTVESHLLEISVDRREVLRVMTVDVSSCVAIETIHDVLQFGIQPVDYWVEGHAVLRGEYDELEIRVANLREKHVNAGTFLEPPTVFVLKNKNMSRYYHSRTQGVKPKRSRYPTLFKFVSKYEQDLLWFSAFGGWGSTKID